MARAQRASKRCRLAARRRPPTAPHPAHEPASQVGTPRAGSWAARAAAGVAAVGGRCGTSLLCLPMAALGWHHGARSPAPRAAQVGGAPRRWCARLWVAAARRPRAAPSRCSAAARRRTAATGAQSGVRPGLGHPAATPHAYSVPPAAPARPLARARGRPHARPAPGAVRPAASGDCRTAFADTPGDRASWGRPNGRCRQNPFSNDTITHFHTVAPAPARATDGACAARRCPRLRAAATRRLKTYRPLPAG